MIDMLIVCRSSRPPSLCHISTDVDEFIHWPHLAVNGVSVEYGVWGIPFVHKKSARAHVRRDVILHGILRLNLCLTDCNFEFRCKYFGFCLIAFEFHNLEVIFQSLAEGILGFAECRH